MSATIQTSFDPLICPYCQHQDSGVPAEDDRTPAMHGLAECPQCHHKFVFKAQIHVRYSYSIRKQGFIGFLKGNSHAGTV